VLTPLLDIRNLNVGFPGASREERASVGGTQGSLLPANAVRDLSLSIAAGEVLGLVGESSSSKSVASLVIMRLLPPQAVVSGEILFANGTGTHDLLDLCDPQMRQLRRSGVGMLCQELMTTIHPGMGGGDRVA